MTILTIDDVLDTFGDDLEDWQREANRKWLVDVYNTLDDGGVLGIPNSGQFFIKKRWGFVEKDVIVEH